jgi:hypothetical protein
LYLVFIIETEDVKAPSSKRRRKLERTLGPCPCAREVDNNVMLRRLPQIVNSKVGAVNRLDGGVRLMGIDAEDRQCGGLSATDPYAP